MLLTKTYPRPYCDVNTEGQTVCVMLKHRFLCAINAEFSYGIPNMVLHSVLYLTSLFEGVTVLCRIDRQYIINVYTTAQFIYYIYNVLNLRKTAYLLTRKVFFLRVNFHS